MALYSSTETYTLNLNDNFNQTVIQLPAIKLVDRLRVLQTLLQETLVDLIATGLTSNRVQDKTELLFPEQYIILQAKFFICENLSKPDLDRNLVVKRAGMSVRRLNEIFAKQDESISAFIRRMRLEAVAADLKDNRFGHQTNSEIAFRYGISNLQSFSLLFRSTYGQSPRVCRAHSFP